MSAPVTDPDRPVELRPGLLAEIERRAARAAAPPFAAVPPGARPT